MSESRVIEIVEEIRIRTVVGPENFESSNGTPDSKCLE